MVKNSIQKMTYDKINDVLYVTFVPDSDSYGDETGGVVLLRDMDTDAITGLTIFSPKKFKAAREKDLALVAKNTGRQFDLSHVSF